MDLRRLYDCMRASFARSIAAATTVIVASSIGVSFDEAKARVFSRKFELRNWVREGKIPAAFGEIDGIGFIDAEAWPDIAWWLPRDLQLTPTQQRCLRGPFPRQVMAISDSERQSANDMRLDDLSAIVLANQLRWCIGQ